MDDTASYITPSAPMDEEAVDAYQLIHGSLQQAKHPDLFMDIITTVLLFEPNLVTLENVLYIIDDKSCRHPKLYHESGRELIASEIVLFEPLVNNLDLVPRFFHDKMDWDDDAPYSDSDLTQVFLGIQHCYQLSYWLRDYVSTANKMYASFKRDLARMEAAQQQQQQQKPSDDIFPSASSSSDKEDIIL